MPLNSNKYQLKKREREIENNSYSTSKEFDFSQPGKFSLIDKPDCAYRPKNDISNRHFTELNQGKHYTRIKIEKVAYLWVPREIFENRSSQSRINSLIISADGGRTSSKKFVIPNGFNLKFYCADSETLKFNIDTHFYKLRPKAKVVDLYSSGQSCYDYLLQKFKSTIAIDNDEDHKNKTNYDIIQHFMNNHLTHCQQQLAEAEININYHKQWLQLYNNPNMSLTELSSELAEDFLNEREEMLSISEDYIKERLSSFQSEILFYKNEIRNPCCMLTIRDSFLKKDVPLSYLIACLSKLDLVFKNVYCLFCRANDQQKPGTTFYRDIEMADFEEYEATHIHDSDYTTHL